MSNHADSGLPRGGRTMIIGMTVVILGLGAFYKSLARNQQKKERLGTNPYYEQRAYAGAVTQPEGIITRPASHVEKRSIPLGPISREQNSKHSTIENYLASPGASEAGRRRQPTPQRSKGDGSGRAYTKSPNYVDSYEKDVKHRKTKEQETLVA